MRKKKYQTEICITICFVLKQELTKKNHKEFLKRYLEIKEDFEKTQGYEFFNWENNVEKIENAKLNACGFGCLIDWTRDFLRCNRNGELLKSEEKKYDKFLDKLQTYFYKYEFFNWENNVEKIEDEYYKVSCYDAGWDEDIVEIFE